MLDSLVQAAANIILVAGAAVVGVFTGKAAGADRSVTPAARAGWEAQRYAPPLAACERPPSSKEEEAAAAAQAEPEPAPAPAGDASSGAEQ